MPIKIIKYTLQFLFFNKSNIYNVNRVPAIVPIEEKTYLKKTFPISHVSDPPLDQLANNSIAPDINIAAILVNANDFASLWP